MKFTGFFATIQAELRAAAVAVKIYKLNKKKVTNVAERIVALDGDCHYFEKHHRRVGRGM